MKSARVSSYVKQWSGFEGPASQALAAQADAARSAAFHFAYQGDAYGTKINLGKTVTSGPSAPVQLACSTGTGTHKTNTVASVNAAPVLSTGTISTAADTFASPVRSRTSARVQGLTALGGVITARVVTSLSSTTHSGSGFHTSASGTTFSSLAVAGIPIVGAVDPNTRIDLPGFGYVILNEQTESIHHRSATSTVNGVHVVVTKSNALDIPVGTNVVVAHARSGLAGPVAATLDGFAYGSKAKAGSVVSSGPSFRVILACTGTNGKVKSDGGAGISLPGILETGAVQNTAQGLVDRTSATGETTSTVDDATVLDSLVQATVIKADTHAWTDGTNSAFSDAGSSFGSLAVAGFPGIGQTFQRTPSCISPGWEPYGSTE